MSDQPYSREELRSRLMAVGEAQYHHKHPFHLLMHEGKLDRGQLQAWALNRYYYQSRIPIKDAIILSRSDDRDFRRVWRKRIVDHDGSPASGNAAGPAAGGGGIEKWIRLAVATGLTREAVVSCEGILPGVRYAVDAYLELVRSRGFLEAVASSLTELFAPSLITTRVSKLKQLYPWIQGSLDYFEDRMTQAPEDAAMAIEYVSAHARARAEQELCIRALRSKCEILWAQLDALYYSYVSPGNIPPGAFQPKA